MDRQQDYLLIDLVKKYTHLYNKQDVLYKDKLARNNAWESIGSALNETAEFCEQRWVILRNRFCTERRKYVPSGSGSDAGKQTWPLFKAMEFIDKFIVPRRTHSNVKIMPRANNTSSCGRENEPRPSCSTASSWMEDPLALNASAGASKPWTTLMAEEETAVENTDTSEYSYTSGITPNAELNSAQTNITEATPELIQTHDMNVEDTDHEQQTSVLRSESKKERKNPASKLADSIQNAFGMLNKHLEKSSDGEDMSFGQTVAHGINKIKNAKKRYLLKAKIMQMIAENISDDEV